MAGQVQVLAVRGDTPATRRFIKEELQVNSLPALLLFPAQSRMYFRYRSPHRDALSLQRFIQNMTALTAPSAAAEAPGHPTQQDPAAASVQAAPTATAATAAGGKHHVSASMAAVRQQLEVVVSSAASGGVPAAVTLTEVKGQMVGLAAVMGISLAVAQTVSNSNSSSSSGSQSAGNGSGAATGEQQVRAMKHSLQVKNGSCAFLLKYCQPVTQNSCCYLPNWKHPSSTLLSILQPTFHLQP
jgi:hypothetical protein